MSLSELFVTVRADREVIKMLDVGNVSQVFWWERLNYDMLNRKGFCLVIEPIIGDVRYDTNPCTQEWNCYAGDHVTLSGKQDTKQLIEKEIANINLLENQNYKIQYDP